MTFSYALTGMAWGKTNRLRAACEQDGKKVHLRFWINDKLAAEVSDGADPLPNGDAGLMAQAQGASNDNDLQTYFDLSSIG